MSNNNYEELDVHSFIEPKYKTKRFKITMTNETKQTAVQEFWDKIALKLSVEQLNEVLPLLEQAKEMEKEQIKGAWNHGFDWGMMEQSLAEQGEQSTLIDANYYYNETYGGN
jgi:hypothetical protein